MPERLFWRRCKPFNSSCKKEETILQKSKNLLARIDGLRLAGWLAEGTALAAGFPTFGLVSKIFGTAQNALDGIQDATESKQVLETGKAVVDSGKNLIKPPNSKLHHNKLMNLETNMVRYYRIWVKSWLL